MATQPASADPGASGSQPASPSPGVSVSQPASADPGVSVSQPASPSPGASGSQPASPSPGASGACANLPADIAGLLGTPINFDTDGFTLTADSQQVLDQVADRLKSCPDSNVAVNGYTDDTGDDATNIPLSDNRAKSVANYLVSQGVAGGHVTSTGLGSANPIADNNTPDGRAQNRRVEITVS